MLKKLLKYDLKWVYKVIGVYYIICLILALLTRVFGIISSSVLFDVISKISSGALITGLINIFINNFIRLWVRFLRNMYKDEAYLTHTLPVDIKKIYLSKVLASIILLFTSTIVVLICLFIAYYTKDTLQIIKETLKLVASSYDTSVIKLLLSISFVIFVEALFIVIIGYVGIVLGHKSNKNKMGRSIIYSMGLYLLTQGITLLFIVIYGLINKDVGNLVKTSSAVSISAIKAALYFAVILYSIYIVVYYLIGQKSLKKGIDID